MTDLTNGQIEINMVPQTPESAKCRSCNGTGEAECVRVGEDGWYRLGKRPCPICHPEWWRDNPDAPGKARL